MRTPITERNPFFRSRRFEQAYAWEQLHSIAGGKMALRLLDFGTFDGNFLSIADGSGLVLEGIGVDVNSEALISGTTPITSRVRLIPIKKREKLDFPDAYFDAICLIGVLEHIYDQDGLLIELRRLLKPSGRLIVSVPGQHLFSFLDLGNLKFRFPRLHRWFYLRRHSSHEYHERFIECRNGLIGDIEVEKGWHEHFTHMRLRDKLESNGFEIIDMDGYGFFFRLIHNLWYLSPIGRGFLEHLMRTDSRAFSSAELFATCIPRMLSVEK